MATIRLLDARRGLNRKCEELFSDARIAESIYRYLCDGIEECEDADVVEVVRCKDCKHYRDSFPYDTCDVFDAKATDEEDFCSYGERKETEDGRSNTVED